MQVRLAVYCATFSFSMSSFGPPNDAVKCKHNSWSLTLVHRGEPARRVVLPMRNFKTQGSLDHRLRMWKKRATEAGVDSVGAFVADTVRKGATCALLVFPARCPLTTRCLWQHKYWNFMVDEIVSCAFACA